MRLWAILLLALLTTAFSAEQSCMARCEYGFDSQKTCQCDSMCKYYKSCCLDYEIVCRRNTRGDTFVLAEDDYDDNLPDSTPTMAPGRSVDDESSSSSRPISTHSPRTHKNPLTKPEITKATEELDIITEAVPVTQMTPTSQRVPFTQMPPISKRVPFTPMPPISQRVPFTQMPPISQRVPFTQMPPISQRVPFTQMPPISQRVPFTQMTPISKRVPFTQMTPISKRVPSTKMTPISQRVPSTQMTPISKRVPFAQMTPITHRVPVTQAPSFATTAPVRAATTEAPDPDAEICSGKPFDSFMQLKNGSIYAFRGEHFFELGQKSVVPGYPKLIKDVWGISGPIDAAFTRVNCQGKTYIFKGNKYWRFDDGVLDDDYPRDISVGFHNIPDHVDAAFALPALSHHGKEKVYFFKGDQYYLYEFMHQPSHGECITMSESSPSTLFRRYTDMSYYESFFSKLFSDMYHHHSGHHFIDKDWHGIKSPVDAVLAGRIYVAPLSPTPDPSDSRPNQQEDQQQGQQWNQQSRQYGQQWNQQYGQQGGRRRQNRSPSWESIAERGMSMGQGFAERGMSMGQGFAKRGMDMGQGFAERGMDMGRGFTERGMDMGQGFAERGMDMGLRLAEKRMEMEERFQQAWNRRWDQDWDQHRRRDSNQQYNSGNDDSRSNRRDDGAREFIHRSQPLQSVYFFKGDKYFRVDLKTKRVDTTIPPYPRSIAKYWLGCSDTRAEKK